MTRLAATTIEEVEQSADPLPDDAPVVIGYHVTEAASAKSIATEVISEFQTIALALFPRWLTPGSSIPLQRTDAEELVRQLCATTVNFAPFVMAMTHAALAGHRPPDSAPEVQIEGLVRLIARAYNRDDLALIIDIEPELDAHQQASVSAACEWIAERGHACVWLPTGALPCVDRYSSLRFTTHRSAKVPRNASASHQNRSGDPYFTITPPEGAPAPNSECEQRLEKALAGKAWANGRVWNRNISGLSRLIPVMRIDLLWPDAKLAIEVDGSSHWNESQYQKDRLRDNTLQMSGYMVLRYTNAHILINLGQVVSELCEVLKQRRARVVSAAPIEEK